MGVAAVAAAQTPDVSQVQQNPGRAAAAAPPAQIGVAAPKERATIGQLPKGLSERRGAPPSAIDASRSADVAPELTATRRNPASVNADEIARLLDEGQATSIDAAAAIASGATTRPVTEPEERAAKLREALLHPGPGER